MSGARIAGLGAYRPRTVVDNDAFAAPRFRVSSAARQRHHAAEDETSVLMATRAAQDALAHARISASDIDLVIGFSGMPDHEFPKDTNLLVQTLGTGRVACWTVDTACASFITGLRLGHTMIATGQHRRVLVVMSMIWTRRGLDRERTDYSSLGDGAAAAVLEASTEASLIDAAELTDAEGFDFVTLKSPFATGQVEHFAFSADPKYKSYFVDRALTPARELLARRDPKSVTWLVAHQASVGLLTRWAEALGIPPERCLHTFGETGNLSAVNIPMVLDHFVNREPKIARGDTLLLFAPGAGMHLAAMLWRY